MLESFVTRSLALILGYAYPAYECFKTVELNKPDIEQLLFWCQYWILVAALTVFERLGDNFISWIPMYSEAKLVFFVHLWCPKTKGTTYIYETFFRPYVAKHESEIDRNLLELRTRAGDVAVLYFQKFATYGQTRIFEVLQYVASQAPSQSSRPHHVQHQQQQTQHIRRAASTVAARDPTDKQHKGVQLPEPLKAGGPPIETVALASSSSGQSSQPKPATSSLQPPTSENNESLQAGPSNTSDRETQKEDHAPPVQESPIEEALLVTRGRLRKRAAVAGSSAQ